MTALSAEVSVIKRPVIIRFIIESFFYLIAFLISYLLCKDYNLILALGLFVLGLASYFYYAISGKNILDLRAIFIGMWLMSLGVAQVRLSSIQVPWSFITWLCFFLAVFCFNLGFTVSNLFVKKKILNTTLSLPKNWTWIKYEYKPKRTLYAALFLTAIAVILFIIQIYMKGFIPIFVQRYDAYTQFYNRLAIFVNLIAIAAPLAFWSYKNLELTKLQKIIMITILFLPTIIFQLAVQRGLFIMGICLLAVPAIFLSKRKSVAVFMLLALTIFGIGFSTAMRNIPADSMVQIWKLDNEIIIKNPNKTDANEPDVDSNPSSNVNIHVPSFLYAPYYYCINGLENFNYMATNLQEHSYGIKQISVLSVILRFDAFKELIASYPSYAILPNSTNCLISDFYYDFGVVGVAIEMIIWGMICSFIQILFAKTKRPCSAVAYGICLFTCAMSFFAAWLSYFSTFLFGGGCLLVYLYINFTVKLNKR